MRGHPPIRMSDFLANMQGVQGDVDTRALVRAINLVDHAMRQGSVLVFCKQGCRRGAALVGCYRMAKTSLEPWRIFQHLQ